MYWPERQRVSSHVDKELVKEAIRHKRKLILRITQVAKVG